MRTEQGAAAVFAHEVGYAHAQVATARVGELPGRLLPVAKNFGRLVAIHQLAVADGVRRAGADDRARLRDRYVWIHLGQIAAGMIPTPGGALIGAAKGFGIGQIADRLLATYYTRPLADDAADRRSTADRITRAEEEATKLLVQRLAATTPGSSPAAALVSDAFQAGQHDAEEYLLPDVPHQGGS